MHINHNRKNQTIVSYLQLKPYDIDYKNQVGLFFTLYKGNIMIYGYCRVSTKTQKLDRQINNVTNAGAEKLYTEKFTGTVNERLQWQKLLKAVKAGDTIIFDSVSRMSRNSDDGIKDYFNLLNSGVELIFLNEPHINSSVYGESLVSAQSIQANDEVLNDTVLKGIRDYMVKLAEKQIRIAFDQSEKEAKDIKKRVQQGIANSAKDSGAKSGNTHAAKTVPVDKIKHYIATHDKVNKSDLARYLGVSRPTAIKWLTEIN